MAKSRDKRYCTLDHANKRRELAQQTPYQFWVRQLERRSTTENPAGPEAGRRKGCEPGK